MPKRSRPALAPTGRFESDTLAAMQRLRRVLADVVEALPGTPARAIDLQRTLELDSKLSWQVFKIVKADDLLSAAQHVPRDVPVTRLLRAAGRRGVPATRIDAVRNAMADFDDVVRRHGPDRTAFDSLVSSATATEDSAATDLFHRRSAFRSLSHLWGVQIGTFISCMIVRRGIKPGTADRCTLSFRVGQQRLRPSADLVVQRFRWYGRDSDGRVVKHTSAPEPLDPVAAANYGAALLPPFCSQPMPRFRTVKHPSGWTQTELDGDEVGRQSSHDLAFGLRFTGSPLIALGPDLVVRNSTLFTSPAELFVADVLMHRGDFGELVPSSLTLPKAEGADYSDDFSEAVTLPMFDRCMRLGPATRHATLDEAPSYAPALSYAAGVMGWDLADFDLYRLRLPYPILHSVVRTKLALPPGSDFLPPATAPAKPRRRRAKD